MAHVRIDADILSKVRKVQKETYSRSLSHTANLLIREGLANWKRKLLATRIHNGQD